MIRLETDGSYSVESVTRLQNDSGITRSTSSTVESTSLSGNSTLPMSPIVVDNVTLLNDKDPDKIKLVIGYLDQLLVNQGVKPLLFTKDELSYISEARTVWEKWREGNELAKNHNFQMLLALF